MRDKVLLTGWGEQGTPSAREISLLDENGCFLVLFGLSALLRTQSSVPVSVQGGVKMSIDEFLSFFDRKTAWRDQEAEEFLRKVPRKDLDTIFATESLFRGTVLDFKNLSSHSGGGSYANNGFAVN